MIRGRHEEVAEDERIQPVERERPRPRPRMHNRPPESQDIGEVEAEQSGDMDDGPGALRGESSQGCAVGPEVRIGLVPGVMEHGLEAQGRDMEVPAMVQSGEIENMAGPSRRRNPRCRVQLDTTNT